MKHLKFANSCLSIALFASVATLSSSAIAATPLKSLSKPPAPGCAGKTFVDPGVNSKAGSRYMFMMVFKAGSGGKYFGDAEHGMAGCLGDIETAKEDAAAGLRTTNDYVLRAEVCPANCVEPDDGGATLTASKSLEAGSDPLGKRQWGVLSVQEQPLHSAVAGNTFEVWQVAVRDACQARELLAHYSADGQLLAKAKDTGEFMGTMLIGFRIKNNGATEACK